MALDKVTYVDNENVIYADNLNDIQDAIIAAESDLVGVHADLDELDTKYYQIDTAVADAATAKANAAAAVTTANAANATAAQAQTDAAGAVAAAEDAEKTMADMGYYELDLTSENYEVFNKIISNIDNNPNTNPPSIVSGSAYQSVEIPRDTTWKRLQITSNESSAYVTFLTASVEDKTGSIYGYLAEGETERRTVPPGGRVVEYTIPADCDYILIHLKSNNSIVAPKKVVAISDGTHYASTTDLTNQLPLHTAGSYTWYPQSYMFPSGYISNTYVRAAFTDFIAVGDNKILLNLTPSIDQTYNTAVYMKVAEYDAEKTILGMYDVPYGSPYTIGTTAAYIRLQLCYDGNATARNMTTGALRRLFKIRFAGVGDVGDGQRPIFIALGASTVIGAIHHYTGESVTYSSQNYPDVIADALGMTSYNLAIGSTGLIARNGGKNRNIMDIVYESTSDERFANASLITIQFARGNDDDMPYGAWDDYYPYDVDGYFFTGNQTTDNENVSAMVEMGATTFGCLNWCVKWLSEHYPKAHIVVIYGWPAMTFGRSVSVEINGEGTSRTSKIVVSSINQERTAISAQVETWREKLQIPIINLEKECLPFSYFAAKATDSNGQYVLFSTTGSQESPTLNNHPNDNGYQMYARFIAGKISEYFRH